ncbi:MAG: adenylate/guanylate cyclase domain-containing protein [Reyranella sp.]|nr:adenylate/guanylate cyclase domain-containing protein [Reyranella sp.]
MDSRSLVGWLAEAGLRNMPLEEIVDGFGHRLNDAGLRIERMFVGMNTLHPMVRARSLIWDATGGVTRHFEFAHAEIESDEVRQSPFAAMLRDGISEQRYRFDVPECPPGGLPDLPVFDELRQAGMTEWMGWVSPFGELAPAAVGSATEVEHAERLWLVVSATTDRPGGHRDADVAILREILPVFAVAVKAVTMRTISHGLLAAYLGNDPASRVFSGTVLRGEAQSLEAVLFFTDLQGFTALADTMPGKELIALLDDYFGCMVQPVVERSGEVLKFMGDGMLAAFAVILDERAEVCAAALEAAKEVLALVKALNAERTAAGKPVAALDISLHIGRVLYGNVGSDQRLDFTVIGPAVNEVSRIEKLCEPLDYSLLISQAFAEAATLSRDRLVSLGRHRLRGVREETELFALA